MSVGERREAIRAVRGQMWSPGRTPAFRRRISTRSGCSCGSYESSWNAVAGRRSSLSKRSSPDPGGARRETVYSTLRGGARYTSSRAELTDFGTNGRA